MSFLEMCISDSLPIWQECLETEFLQRMIDRTLPDACLMGYIVDDSLYLREYAKVFVWGIIHAETMQEMRLMYSLLAFVNESEDATRRKYLRGFGLSDERIQHLPLREENQAYIDAYAEICRHWSNMTDSICEGLTLERKEKCRHLFRSCSIHELRFWQMSSRPRTDL